MLLLHTPGFARAPAAELDAAMLKDPDFSEVRQSVALMTWGAASCGSDDLGRGNLWFEDLGRGELWL